MHSREAGGDAVLSEGRSSPIVKNFQPSGPELFNNMQGSWALTYAQRILDDPQAHIDALVEAGVLKPNFSTDLRNGPRAEHRNYLVIEPPRPPCPAWVEVGYGRQTCVGAAGHDEGEHPTPHSSAQKDGDIVQSYTLWNTGP